MTPQRVAGRLDRVLVPDLTGRLRAHRLQAADHGLEPVSCRRIRLVLVPGEPLLHGGRRNDDVELGRVARGDALGDRGGQFRPRERLVPDDEVGAHLTPPWVCGPVTRGYARRARPDPDTPRPGS